MKHATLERGFDRRYCLSVPSESAARSPPTEHRQPSGSALSHSHCVADHANVSARVVPLRRGNDELSAQHLWHSKDGRQMGHLIQGGVDYGYEF